MAIRFTGTILFVQDVEKMKSFYTRLFQCTVIEEIEKEWVLLKAGNGEIGLHETGDNGLSAGDNPFRAESNTKLVFETDADITVLHKRLTEEQLNPGEIKSWENYPYLLFDSEDPEGNMFQLKQKKG
jgi:predicted enzyme related to lactoylglutathione lyase